MFRLYRVGDGTSGRRWGSSSSRRGSSTHEVLAGLVERVTLSQYQKWLLRARQDTIAMKLGIEKTAMIRVCAGISHCKLERMLAMLLRLGRSEDRPSGWRACARQPKR